MKDANSYLKAVLIGYALLSITIAYLLTAFICWSWNVGEWDTGARALLVVITIVVGAFFSTMYDRVRKDRIEIK